MTYLPNTELVIVAWLKAIPGIDPDAVATTLPEPGTWPGYQFIQPSTVSDDTDPHIPVFRPVVSIDCRAYRPGSKRPPWGQANQLAEIIRMATYRTMVHDGLNLAMPAGYSPARICPPWVIHGPHRMLGDQSHWARYQLDLGFTWTHVGVAVG